MLKLRAQISIALLSAWLSGCEESHVEPEPICEADSPCFDQTGICAGDRQIRIMQSRDCHAVCGPGPCNGAVCVPTKIRDCRSDEVCVTRKVASGRPNAECVPCDDDMDAGADHKPSSDGGVCGGSVGCGDGQFNRRYAAEECDDGNRLDGDGCSADCTIEPGWDCFGAGAPCHRIETADPDCTSVACQGGARCREPSGLTCACPKSMSLAECEPIAVETLGVIAGTNRVYPMGVSRDGSTVVGYASHRVNSDARTPRAVAWTAERGLFSLGFPTDLDSRAVAANADGSVLLAVVSRDAFDYDSYLWTPKGSMRLPLPAGSVANDLSDDGKIVVGKLKAEAGINDMFRWTASGGLENLGHLPDQSPFEVRGQAEAISADGNVVVGISGTGAFRWTHADGMQSLPLQHASDTSADGTYVLGRATKPNDYLPSTTELALRWSDAGGVEWLGSLESTLPGVQSFYEASALSGDGAIAVGNYLRQEEQIPWIWEQARGMRALTDVLAEQGIDLAAWDFRTLAGISGDGKTVVGWGGLAGRQAAFIARLR